MSHVVDYVTVSTAGLESSPHAAALAGLRANESRYFKNKYGHDFTVTPAAHAPDLVAWVAGILAQSAITGPGNTSALCIDIGGAGALSNTFTHSLGGSMAAGDIRVRQRNDGTVRLPGYVDGATDTAAVIAYLNGRNVEVSPSTATAQTTGFAGGGACSQPSF